MSSRSSSHQGKKHNLNHLQKVNQSLFISNHPSYNPLCDDHNYMNLCSPGAPQTIFKRAPWLNLLLVVSQRLTFDWPLTIIFLASSFRLSNDKFRLSSVKLSLWTFKCWLSVFMSALNPIIPGLFLNSIYPGGGKFAPPYKMPNNGREVPKLSWNLISYRDWCQTKGFTTFRHLKPPQLMVWKMTFSGGLWGS